MIFKYANVTFYSTEYYKRDLSWQRSFLANKIEKNKDPQEICRGKQNVRNQRQRGLILHNTLHLSQPVTIKIKEKKTLYPEINTQADGNNL